MSFWAILGIVLVGLIILGVVTNKMEAKKASKKAASLFKHIDTKYENFVEKSISYNILNKEKLKFDIDKLCFETMQLIKPEIQSLIALINSTSTDEVSLDYNSRHFNSVVSYAESFFTKSKKSKDKMLSKEDENKFYESFEDAITADLKTRALDLKSGNFSALE